MTAVAETGLTPEVTEGKSAAQLLALYKKYLRQEEKATKAAHKAGAGGIAVAQMRSNYVDEVLRAIFRVALEESGLADHPDDAPVSFIATGGYGRAVLNPGSDIDVHFLTEKAGRGVPKKVTDLIEKILYPMWDLNFKVGHATRSVKEELLQANEDPQTCTALIDARLICGRSDLFDNLQKRFYKECIRGKATRFLEDRLKDRAQRHAKSDHTPYIQEPNVKQGMGGLREYHNLCWMTYYETGVLGLDVLVEKKLISQVGLQEIEDAYDFLLRVRNDLHYSEKPPGDILTLRLQGRVATHLEYPEKTILRRIESFMKDYYLHTRNLLQLTDEVFDRLKIIVRQKRGPRRAIGWLTRTNVAEHFDGFIDQDNRLWAEQPDLFEQDTHRLMRVFLHSQLRGLRLSAELVNLIRNTSLPKGFRINRDVAETFEEIIARKGSAGSSFRQMHRVGFLGRYIPEFGVLTCLVQHEFFHRYTADEHTLTTLDLLDRLSGGGEEEKQPMADLYRELDDPFALHVALLLHDSGRAANLPEHADASALMAAKVCKRIGLAPHRRQLVLFLVDNHLSLWHTATTRNLDDVETIQEFVAIVKNQRQLDALLVMTYVDANATSSHSWTGWKEALILQLYRATSAYLADAENYQANLRESLGDLRERVVAKLSSGYEEEIDAHFEHLPDSYFLTRGSSEIADHVKAVRGFLKQLKSGDPGSALQPAVRWEPAPERGCTEVIIACWDRHALLARIAGAFAAAKINILSADLFRRTDDLVVDLFKVCTENLEAVLSDVRQTRFETILQVASTDTGIGLDELLVEQQDTIKLPEERTGVDVPRRVFVSNRANDSYTMVQIQTMDRLGLLYDLFRVIGLLGFEITNARIATEKGAAIDTFHLLDSGGRQIADPEKLDRLRRELEAVVL